MKLKCRRKGLVDGRGWLACIVTLVGAFFMIVKTDGSSAALVESLQCECEAMSSTLQSQDWAAAGAWWRSEAGECGTPSAGLRQLPGYTDTGTSTTCRFISTSFCWMHKTIFGQKTVHQFGR